MDITFRQRKLFDNRPNSENQNVIFYQTQSSFILCREKFARLGPHQTSDVDGQN